MMTVVNMAAVSLLHRRCHTTGLTPRGAVSKSRNFAPRISTLRYSSNDAQSGGPRTSVGALGLWDEQRVAGAAYVLRRLRGTGKPRWAVLKGPVLDPRPQREGRRASGIVRFVQPAQGTEAADPRDLAPRPAGGA